MKNLSI